MLRRLVYSLIITVLSAAPGMAAVVPAAPQTGTERYVITAYGAKGDGAALNTDAIQRALDAGGKSGGVVVVPAGRFRCGPLRLHSRTELRLESGAVLILPDDPETFPADDERYQNFIAIDGKAEDVRITGSGTIDGQGAAWWERFTANALTRRRPQLLFGQGVRRLEISGVRFLNPPNTHISLKDCSDVLIRNVRIEAPEKSRNTDGINISVRNCLIDSCDIATGDDNIAINFGGKNFSTTAPECENIEIRNCRFGHGHGLSIGSYTSGNMRGLDVHDCRFEGTTAAIRIKSARGRGGLVENLKYRNIRISGCKWPVYISSYYPKEPKEPETAPAQQEAFTPVYRNLEFSNIVIEDGTDALRIYGLPEAAVTGLLFRDCSFAAKNGMQISNASGVRFENCRLLVQDGPRIRTTNAQIEGLTN